jgi:GntR family transcriptional regulator
MKNGDGMIPSVDKSIPIPLYYQLEQAIKKLIEAGDLKTGDAIPTEKELMEKCEISRATVRQAILQLVNDGYLRREKSKGTFVTSPPKKVRFLESMKGFSAEMELRSIPHYSKLLEKLVIPASEKIAAKLQIAPGAAVYYQKRLRFVNDRPFLIDDHYIPYQLCPGIEEKYKENMSLYRLLEKEYGLNLHHGRREFEPVRPSSKEEIELLEIYKTTVLMYIESVVYLEDNTPVDYFEAKIHGKFTADMVSTSI